MLEVAARNADAAGRRIRYLRGTAETLDPALAPVRLVTIGRAFHWMDRPRVLTVLDGLVASGGAVALFATAVPAVPAVPQNTWQPAFQELMDRYGETDPAREHMRMAKEHDGVLLASPFGHVERVAVLQKRNTPVERFVDRALSYGKTWGGRWTSRREAWPRRCAKSCDRMRWTVSSLRLSRAASPSPGARPK
jgi:hypothetical protein